MRFTLPTLVDKLIHRVAHFLIALADGCFLHSVTSVRAAHSFITRDEQLGSAPRRQPFLAGAFSSLVPRRDKNGIKQPTSVVVEGRKGRERGGRRAGITIIFHGAHAEISASRSKARTLLPPSLHLSPPDRLLRHPLAHTG